MINIGYMYVFLQLLLWRTKVQTSGLSQQKKNLLASNGIEADTLDLSKIKIDSAKMIETLTSWFSILFFATSEMDGENLIKKY